MAAVIYENNPHGDNIVIIPSGGGSGAHFDGLTPATINQGASFDLTAGVKAYNESGNEVPFTVEPTEIDACQIGNQTFTYTAGELTQDRIITVQAISDPVISGLTPLTVEVNEEFDPLDGVSAVDGNGNPVEVTVEEPTPTERLLLRGGAVDAKNITMDKVYIPNFTHVSDEPYDGSVEVKLTGFMCKRSRDSEYVQGESYNPIGEMTYASDGYTVKEVYEPGEGIVLAIPAGVPGGAIVAEIVDGEQTTFVWNSSDGSGAIDCKWDSLEIWTRTE